MITRDGVVIKTAHDLQEFLFVEASDREADMLGDLFIRAGLLVQCDNPDCSWTSPAGAIGGRCEGCGEPVSGERT